MGYVFAFACLLLDRYPVAPTHAESSSDVSAAAVEINRQRTVDAPAHLPIPEFSLVAGQYPAQAAFHAGCFDIIPYELRKNLLTETRNIYKSCTTQNLPAFHAGKQTIYRDLQSTRRIQNRILSSYVRQIKHQQGDSFKAHST